MPVALPPLAVQYLPVLRREVVKGWPSAPFPATLAAQVEQETCPSLKSSKCWNPHAELKTDLEYGFGLGQITVTKRFNNFDEAKKLSPSLKNWTWDNRYNAEYQLRTLVLTNQFNYNRASWAATPMDRAAFAFAAYNGGMGGVLSDRTVCSLTPGCDKNVWFNQVEDTSKKAKVAVKGYGQSFFQINRGYVRNILCVRVDKYKQPMGDATVLVCPAKK